MLRFRSPDSPCEKIGPDIGGQIRKWQTTENSLFVGSARPVKTWIRGQPVSHWREAEELGAWAWLERKPDQDLVSEQAGQNQEEQRPERRTGQDADGSRIVWSLDNTCGRRWRWHSNVLILNLFKTIIFTLLDWPQCWHSGKCIIYEQNFVGSSPRLSPGEDKDKFIKKKRQRKTIQTHTYFINWKWRFTLYSSKLLIIGQSIFLLSSLPLSSTASVKCHQCAKSNISANFRLNNFIFSCGHNPECFLLNSFFVNKMIWCHIRTNPFYLKPDLSCWVL